MSATLTSNAWHRVAGLRPQLRSQARLYRHRYRGEVWYLLQDPASGRVHRFAPGARLAIAAMDGQRTVDQLWDLTNRHLGDDAPTQDEMIQLLGQLHGADLLQSDVAPDTAEAFTRGERERKQRNRSRWSNPMALRLPLWDPDVFLNRLAGAARRVWSGWGALAWLAVVLPALFLVPPHWEELTHGLSDRVLAVDNLLLLWLVFPVIKLLYELGHAFATKAGGGEVHDLGLMFLVLMPVPYVDASAASVFPGKYRRAAVGAGGMLVETLIAAIAFYLWLLAEPGLLRAVLFNTMLVAGVSTVLFNGNPLLRYDAYYILADLIEMPNLAQRSLRYWVYLAERYVFGLEESSPPSASASEKAWLLFYGAGSSVYRVLVTVAIATFIAGKFFVLGALLAMWAVAGMTLLPLAKGLRYLFTSPALQRRRGRALGAVGLVAGLALLFVLAVPLPFRAQSEGVVWLPEEAMVRSGASGLVQGLLAVPGQRVQKDQPLVQLEAPALSTEQALAEARVAELEAAYLNAFAQNRGQAEVLREQLGAAQAARARAREQVGTLTVRAGSAGVFRLPHAEDLPGRFVRKGEVLGHVTDPQLPLVRVVVPQADVDMVRQATSRVQVRLAQHVEDVFPGRLVREVPAGDARLPSQALALQGGGPFATDPQDPQGTRSLERLFQFDIELPPDQRLALFGQRAYVRFDYRWEPLARQWYRTLRRLFLTQFNV